MHRPGMLRHLSQLCVAMLICISVVAIAQENSGSYQSPADRERNAEHVAKILGLSDSIDNLRQLRAQNGCSSPLTLEDLTMRQDVLETIVGGSLDVDGVVAELDNERSRLFELRAILAARRDRSVF